MDFLFGKYLESLLVVGGRLPSSSILDDGTILQLSKIWQGNPVWFVKEISVVKWWSLFVVMTGQDKFSHMGAVEGVTGMGVRTGLEYLMED